MQPNDLRLEMQTDITLSSVTILDGDTVAGCYILDDRFKPHFAVLNSPRGHNVVVVSPADHRHHKGLMYALRCADLNFWEEDTGSGACGVQESLGVEAVADGFRQSLLWREEGGGLETYRETRTVTCRRAGDGVSFEWTWQSERLALRDHRLIKSPWSSVLADGRAVNYHGLGLRLPWSWGYAHDTVAGAEVNGRAADAESLMGSHGPEITMWGRRDGIWDSPASSVTMRQHAEDTWYVLRQPFPFLAVGPTNAEERDVAKAQPFQETYTLLVSDR